MSQISPLACMQPYLPGPPALLRVESRDDLDSKQHEWVGRLLSYFEKPTETPRLIKHLAGHAVGRTLDYSHGRLDESELSFRAPENIVLQGLVVGTLESMAGMHDKAQETFERALSVANKYNLHHRWVTDISASIAHTRQMLHPELGPEGILQAAGEHALRGIGASLRGETHLAMGSFLIQKKCSALEEEQQMSDVLSEACNHFVIASEDFYEALGPQFRGTQTQGHKVNTRITGRLATAMLCLAYCDLALADQEADAYNAHSNLINCWQKLNVAYSHAINYHPEGQFLAPWLGNGLPPSFDSDWMRLYNSVSKAMQRDAELRGMAAQFELELP